MQNGRLYKSIMKLLGNEKRAAIFSSIAAPVLQITHPVNRCSEAAEDVLERLGYDPEILKQVCSSPIRVYKRDLKGLLSLIGREGEFDSTNHKIFSDSLNGCAFYVHKDFLSFSDIFRHKFSAAVPFIRPLLPLTILPDLSGLSYKSALARISLIPEEHMDNPKGDINTLQAFILFHEAKHLDIERVTIQYYDRDILDEEILFDKTATETFRKSVKDPSYELTLADFFAVRCIRDFLSSLYKPDDPDFLHSTQFHWSNPSRRDSAQDVLDACRSVVFLIQRYLGKETREPLFSRAYKAARLVMEREDLSSLEIEAIGLFTKAIEHFCPSYIARLNVAPASTRDRPEHHCPMHF